MAGNPYYICPDTRCPVCQLPEEDQIGCEHCGQETLCPDHGCTNFHCESYRKPNERANYLVSVYDAALAYGGPEEGGWHYNRGELVRTVRVCRTEDAAYKYCRRLNERLRSRKFGPNHGKREKSSVLSDGVFEAHVHRHYAPLNFPERRPHYE